MKRNYYYLVAGLQDILLDVNKLIYSQLGFREILKTGVHPADYRLVEKLFLPFDNINLLNLLQKNNLPFLEKGNYSRERMEDNITEPYDLPDYMAEFIPAFKNNEPLFPELSPENELTTLFYKEMLDSDNEFLKNWFRFDLNIRNIFTALISRKHKLPYENQIIGTDEVSETLRRSHLRDFGLGGEIDYLEALVEISKGNDIQTREKESDQLRWDYLDEVTFFEYFTIEKLLAYTIKLGLAERWLALDHEYGSIMFTKLLNELRAGYKLPDTFNDK